MDRTTNHLVIDARPRGPRGAIACEVVEGRSLLERVLDLAVALSRSSSEPIEVVVQAEDETKLRPTIEGHASGRFLVASTVPEGAAVLRTDRLYDMRALRKAIRRADDLEVAALWRLDGPHGLAGAAEELIRRQSYQPLGGYWALTPARWIGRVLAPTMVHPNAVTLAASACFLGACALVACATPSLLVRVGTASLLAVALVLDTADGHLARLQGTSSAFGRWLDGWLDEVGDMALHASIAWSAHTASGSTSWLLVGMLYGMGKYLFAFGSVATSSGSISSTSSPIASNSPPARWLRIAGHADVRWHLWILLAALGHLEFALAFHAGYYPLRAVLGAARRVVRRA
jgi:phosphatidylglycerophosphate synthase